MTIEDNKAKREKIVAKIKALLDKTTANGCTEAEAVAAAEAANRLMEDYDLTYTDLETEVRGEIYGTRRKRYGTGKVLPDAVMFTAKSIAEYCNCRVWKNDNELIYYGSQDDTQLAQQLSAMVQMAAEGEFARYLKGPQRSPDANGRSLRGSFMIGFSNRVAERFRSMAKDREQKPSTTGTALVVVKNQVTTEKYAEFCRKTGHVTTASRASRRTMYEGAYKAGQEAGSRADLGGSKVSGNTQRTIR